jgi:hypothetical protein
MKRLAENMFEEFERCTVKVRIYRRIKDKLVSIHDFIMDAEKEIDIALEALEWIQENIEWKDSEKIHFDYEVLEFLYPEIYLG